MEGTIRLNKYLSDAGVCSRREADRLVEEGKVRVDGEIAVMGMQIRPGQKVVCDGKPVGEKEKPVFLIVNKPRGIVCTTSDKDHAENIVEFLNYPQRIYPVGRLDKDSEGLLILTNDGEVANKLMHPKNHVEKIYHVKIKTEIEPEKLAALNEPMVIDDYKIKPVKVTILERKEGYTILKFVLSEGRNRQIRKMCEQLELQILRLKRVTVGELTIGMLTPGKWKYMNFKEISYLKSL